MAKQLKPIFKAATPAQIARRPKVKDTLYNSITEPQRAYLFVVKLPPEVGNHSTIELMAQSASFCFDDNYTIRLSFYENIHGDAYKYFYKWCSEKLYYPIELELLNTNGSVANTFKFPACRINRLEVPNLDYGDNDIMRINVEFVEYSRK